jgi:hypothetical protein
LLAKIRILATIAVSPDGLGAYLATETESEAKNLVSACKPLKSPDLWKEKIWILFPFALDFLPKGFELASKDFYNPSLILVEAIVSRETTLPFLA